MRLRDLFMFNLIINWCSISSRWWYARGAEYASLGLLFHSTQFRKKTTGTPGKEEEEDPEEEIFPKTAFFGSFTIMRIEWRGKEGRRTHARVRRQSRMQIGDSRRPRSSRRRWRRERGGGKDGEVELGEGEKELSFPLSFIVFSGLFGWSLSFPLSLTHSFGKDSFLQLLLGEPASQPDR